MNQQNLIRASANVVKITNLKVGDVVKQIEASNYDDGIFYALVTDILNNGEDAFITLTRYKKSYSGIDCGVKTFSGKQELNIFPATVDEVKEHLNEAIEKIARDIENEQRTLDGKRKALENTRQFISMETSKKLTECSFRELTQLEYDKIKQGNVL